MRHNVSAGTRFFFATAALPCPYLPGRVERRVVTELVGRDVIKLHDRLSAAGFRRSHGAAYAPACPDCDACVPVRVIAPEFRASRTQRRVMRANQDLEVRLSPPRATPEQFQLFSRYQQERHHAGDMAKMDYFDYQTLIEETPVETMVAEFRRPGDDELLAACLIDCVEDGYSAVYSFYDSAHDARSLGSFMILWMIEKARLEARRNVYLGFWIRNCRKMSYKIAYQPLEGYVSGAWRPVTVDSIV